MFVYPYISYILNELLNIDQLISVSGLNYIGSRCDILNTIEFDPVDEKDEILIGKGMDCRRLYFEQYGIWPREGPCTMFEMMAGLAMSCDEMLSPEPSKTTPWMFFKHMLDCIYSYGNINAACAHYRTELLQNNIDGWAVDIWAQCNQVSWNDIL